MARATWSGQVSFGLVSVPVKLFTAARSHDIQFRQIHEKTGARVRQKRIDAQTGEEVDSGAIVRGYETNGHYILLKDDEIEQLKPEASRSVEILDFVELAEIEPIYYDRPYYLMPDGDAARKPYRLLVEAMERTGKAAIATFVMRTKEHLAAIRPRDGVLLLSTMRYADEVVEPEDLDADVSDVEISDRELKMAEQLIGSLVTEFDPSAYEDSYQQRLLELIEAKAEGGEPTVAVVDEEPGGEVVDLMEALEQSLRGGRSRPRSQPDPDTERYEQMTKDELYALAQEVELAGRSRMSKDELVKALATSQEVSAAG